MPSKKFLNIVGFIAKNIGVCMILYLMDLLFNDFTVVIMIFFVVGVFLILQDILGKKETND
jgi:hypothetical protein